MKRIICTLGAGAWCVFAAWLAGVDFNERGVGTFFTYLYTTFCLGLVYWHPNWTKE